MELATLNSSISEKQFSPVYIFAGLETTIRDIYINEISKAFQLKKSYVEAFKDVITASQKSLFNETKLYIVKDDKQLLTLDTLIDKLKNYDSTSPVIICYPTLDKRKLFYREFEEKIVWFNYLETKQLIPYVEREIPNGDMDFYEDLIYVCGNDYGRLLLEINKVQLYSKLKIMTPQSSFYSLISKGVIKIPDEDEIFKLSDSLLTGDFKEVLKKIDNYELDEAIKNLSALYSVVRNHYLVRTYHGKGRIETDLNIPKFIIGKIERSKKYFTINALENSMNLIMNTIYKIIKGQIDINIAFQYVVLKISSFV
jgi:DNA polymerase III delta subunit